MAKNRKRKRTMPAHVHLSYDPEFSSEARHLSPSIYARVTGATKQQHIARKKKGPVVA